MPLLITALFTVIGSLKNLSKTRYKLRLYHYFYCCFLYQAILDSSSSLSCLSLSSAILNMIGSK